MPNSMLNDPAKTLSDIPFWVVVMLAMAAGLSGEMLRASAQTKLTPRQIIGRILMRFGAAGMTGIAVFMVSYAFGAHPYTAAALCIFASVVGGDVATGMIERAAAKRLGVLKPGAPPESGDA